MFVWKSMKWDEMRNQMNVTVTAMVASLGIVGIVLCGLGVQQYQETRHFLTQAQLVDAKVVDFQAQPVRRNSSTRNKRPILEYTISGVDVQKETGNYSVFWEYEIGDEVKVYVDPFDSQVMPVIASWWQIYDDVCILFFAGTLFAFTSIIIFVFSFGLLTWEKKRT